MKLLTLLVIGCLLLFRIEAHSQEQLEVNGAIIIQNSNDFKPVPGTIRWTGHDFEGWNGQRWVSLTGYAVVGTVTDLDSNTYQTSRMGDQEWMLENLRVSQYQDGSPIPQIGSDTAWSELTSGAWCWYNDEDRYDAIYGKLYNWHAVDFSRGLCPTGWHVPTNEDWTALTDFLGGIDVAGSKMKESGPIYWDSPNIGASNESGFTGLPGGFRNQDGTFFEIGAATYWWTDSEAGINAWFRALMHDNDDVGAF